MADISRRRDQPTEESVEPTTTFTTTSHTEADINTDHHHHQHDRHTKEQIPVEQTATETTDTISLIPAAQTALYASSDRALRVPCYCEENVWRLAYRRLHSSKILRTTTTTTTTNVTSPPVEHSDTLAAATHTSFVNSSSKSSTTTPSTSSSSSNWYVAFISNPNGCVPMFRQLAAATGSGLHDRSKDQPVFWDYHVILIEVRTRTGGTIDPTSSTTTTTPETATASTSSSLSMSGDIRSSGSSVTTTTTFVWDIDSLLPCPCPIKEYMQTSFHNFTNWPSKYSPYFRLIDAELYLQHFSSDRSHMLNQSTGEWSSPPPPYDCITGNGNHNDTSNDTTENNRPLLEDGTKGNVNRKTPTNSGDCNTMKQYMTMTQSQVDQHMGLDINIKHQRRKIEPLGIIYSVSQLYDL